jgi:ABC-2 type transport system ATP-binding protein
MISINQLDFGYKKNKKLFSELNLKLEKGRIYGLLGKNGSGKTTLLKQTAGLLYPDSGTVMLNGQSAGCRSTRFLAGYYLIPEEFETPGLSIKNFIKINSPFYPDFNEEQFYQYLAEFKTETEGKLNKLSYGQKKKVLIAFGLAANTPVLMSDEPTNGLDIPSKSMFRKIMASGLTEDRLFIISTHQVKDIEGIIDSVVILDNGKIIFNQSLETIGDKLCFKSLKSIDEGEVLYSEKHLNTYEAVVKKTNGESTRVNLELLFNSIVDGNGNVVNEFSNR